MNQLARYIILIAATSLVGFLLWFFSSVIIYILVAAVLSFVGHPVMEALLRVRIRKLRIPRAISAALTLMLIWGVFLLFFSFFIPLIVGQLNAIANLDVHLLISSIQAPVEKIQSAINAFLPTASAVDLQSAMTEKVISLFKNSGIQDAFGSAFGLIKGFAVACFAITFITFFFLKSEANLFTEGIVLLFPSKYEENITRALGSINRLLVRYFLGIFTDILCVMTLLSLGLMLVAGFPFKQALLIGLLAGILNMVPYVGPLFGMLIGLSFGILDVYSGAVPLALDVVLVRMLIVFLMVQVLDASVLQPLIYSNSVRAHPLEIFLVILIAGSIGGILGMLIAIPTYTVIRVLAKEFFNHFRVVQSLTKNI